MNKNKKAIILGGGGHFGIAWELGYLRGLDEASVPIREVDIVVGTSAGSQVGTIVTSNKDWDLIWKEQIEKEIHEVTPISDEAMARLFDEFNEIEQTAASAKEWIAAQGEISKRTPIFLPVEERAAMLKERFGSGEPAWNKQLRIVATNIENVDRKVFDSQSGVDILDALQASSALPGVWPAVEINGKHYFDGGSYSMENPDVVDADKMLILSTGLPIAVPYKLEDLVTGVEKKGIKAHLVLPSEEVMAILKKFNFNTMEAKIRPFVADAGREQGRKDAETIQQFWR